MIYIILMIYVVLAVIRLNTSLFPKKISKGGNLISKRMIQKQTMAFNIKM